MQPTFKVNELIVVKKSNEDTQYYVGDIITYYDQEIDIDVTHRIVEIAGENFYTKGDYNNARDLNSVNKDQIVGKVVYNSYFLGNLYINYKFVIITLIIITVIVLNFNTKKEDIIETIKVYR